MHRTLLVCAAALLCVAAANAQKQYKEGEYDTYNAAFQALSANDPARALTALDAWKAKYPQSDYDPERQILYLRAYAAIVGKPQPDETAGRAARALLAMDRPALLSEAEWAKARPELHTAAKSVLLYLAMVPGNQAMTRQPRDCPAAEAAYRKTLDEFPDAGALAFNLANALVCQKKNAEGVYQYQRAAFLDPARAAAADSAYTRLHGSAEGLAELKELVKRSPLPPAGFAIKTADEIQSEKEAELQARNPQLALWNGIRTSLAAPDYFKTQLENAAVPELRGVLVEARPACRPKQLLVAPGGPGAPGEVLLKLDGALPGKPEPGAEIRWSGVPTAFTPDPFLLTMDTESKGIKGLTLSRCTPK